MMIRETVDSFPKTTPILEHSKQQTTNCTPLGLNHLKVQGDKRLPDYEKGMSSVIDIYSIPDSAFEHDKRRVIEGAVRLLSGYDVNSLFLEEPERSLFTLAIANAWLSTKKTDEKRKLLDILKLLCVRDKENMKFGTFSGRVRILSEQGFSRGVMFDPENKSGNQYSEHIKALQNYIKANASTEQTLVVHNILTDWTTQSLLDKVRKKLRVTQDKERPFDVLVLNKSALQMTTEIGYASFNIGDSITSTMVFNSDWQRYNSLEHEYAHSQSLGLLRWSQYMLFRGINEALTEETTSNPMNYIEQRKVLKQILDSHPDLETLMYDAYIGNGDARKALFSKILTYYGLGGFLVFARMAPLDIPQISDKIGKSVYIDPRVATIFFSAYKESLLQQTPADNQAPNF